MNIRIARTVAALLVGCAAFLVIDSIGTAIAQSSSSAYYRAMFHFKKVDVAGFPTGAVQIKGGGGYDWDTGYLHANGAYSCTASVQQGPLNGCLEQQGTRWEGGDLLFSTTFQCTGNRDEPVKIAVTSDHTVVLLANFYLRRGGNVPAYRAKMIVSTEDLAPELPGGQNVWIEGVGCGRSDVRF